MEEAKLNKKRLPVLDGIRSIAVMLVVLFHLNVYYGSIPIYTEMIKSGGVIGVSLFFFLSGFLMASPYVSQAKRQGTLYSFLTFYKARFLRILPLLFFSSAVFLALRHYNPLNKGISDIYSWEEYIQCLFLWDNRIVRLNPVLWTLRVEIIFYILYPLIGYVLYLSIVRQCKALFYGILTTLILVSVAVFVLHVQDDHSFLSSCYMLLLGTLNRILYEESTDRLKCILSSLSVNVVIVLAVISVVYVYAHSEEHPRWEPLLILLLNVFFLIVVLGNGLLTNLLSYPFYAVISLLSYSLYLWHFNLHYMLSVPLQDHLFETPSILGIMFGHAFSLTAAFLVSYLSYYLIEKPVLKWKK